MIVSPHLPDKSGTHNPQMDAHPHTTAASNSHFIQRSWFRLGEAGRGRVAALNAVLKALEVGSVQYEEFSSGPAKPTEFAVFRQ
ncbi:MAG TPA: hypothetical protein VJV03_00535 [Pyrinomonadaceae bacterium]|nr:hypothetical protein [Pyrinomonadaceae bacterium]